MLMIRMQRIGRKNDPAFRILVLEKTSSPKAGTYTDQLGTYNPKTKALTVAADRLKDWMSKGAQLSPSLQNLLIEKKVLEGKKTAVIAKSKLEKNVAKKAEEEATAKAAEEAAAAKAAEDAAAATATPGDEPAPEVAPEPVTEEAPAA
jgi:small subunit ribosomal protein S16